MKKIMNHIIICLIIFVAVAGYGQGNERLMVEQVAIPIVNITEASLIQFFLDEFMIIEEDINRMEVIDATRNGFGEDDLIKLYPSNQIYFKCDLNQLTAFGT